MPVPFYAKSEDNQGYIKNLEVVGFSDLNGINDFKRHKQPRGGGFHLALHGQT